MQYRGVNELRELFLAFFEEKGCLRLNSFSLVPHNDTSLLIINSGMAPMKPWFTGQEIPPRRRESQPAIVNRSQGYPRKEDDADDGVFL